MKVLKLIWGKLKAWDKAEGEKQRIMKSATKQTIILVLVCVFSVWVGYHLLKYSVLDGDKWRVLANNQQMSSVTIRANRGSILDTNGTVLAQSSTVWDVIISPQDINKANQKAIEKYNKAAEEAAEEGKSVEAYVPRAEIICRGLADILDVDYDKLMKATTNLNSQHHVVKRKVEKPEVNEINIFMADNGIDTGSVFMEETSKRYYPNDSLASNIIGFTNYEGDGVYGLEAYYDNYLSGTDGKAVYAKDAYGREMAYTNDAYYSAVDGYSLVLTLDEVLQHYLEKNLELCVSQHSIVNRACGIIMDCNTGAVLAMSTAPSYDLNNPSKLYSAYDLQKLEQLSAADGSEEEIANLEATYREQQWKNKAITELYYPGSVFKTITCAAALEEEVVSLDDTFDCYGVFDVSGTPIKCHQTGGGHGTLTLQQAVTKSCNPSFIQIGQRLGSDLFSEYFEAFGFTERTGIDLPGETGSLYISRENMGPVELASSAFGQTNKVTPIQMATAFCAVVNGGYLVTPYVVDKILDSDGNVVQTTQVQVKRQVISEETSAQMRSILENVVQTNGGSNAYISGYRIGGKSGTTEKIDEHNKLLAEGIDHMDYVPSFAAFAPADDPRIVMLVMADTPTGTQYYGSAVCAPVVSAVFKEGLPHLGVYPTYTAEELAKMDAAVPYVLGYEAMRAESSLAASGFEVRIIGDTTTNATVSTQIPAASMSIPKGSTVVLYLGTSDSYELESGVIPDVIGMTVQQANEAITNAGFNIKITGGAAENANAVAVGQSLAAGTDAYKGNVIEVTFQVNSYSD